MKQWGEDGKVMCGVKKKSNKRTTVKNPGELWEVDPIAPGSLHWRHLLKRGMKISPQLTKAREGVFIMENQLCNPGSANSFLKPRWVSFSSFLSMDILIITDRCFSRSQASSVPLLKIYSNLQNTLQSSCQTPEGWILLWLSSAACWDYP